MPFFALSPLALLSTISKMLRGESPIFDTPDLPSVRRTKPLPKRRRTSESSSRDDVTDIMGYSGSGIPADGASLESSSGLVSAESILALQSYYMPILGGMRDLLRHEIDGGLFGGKDPGVGVFGGLRTGRGHEEDEGESEYLDHFQQPGNTKKRKVPANLAAMGPGREMGDGGSDEDEPTDRAIPTGRPDYEYDVVGTAKGHSAFAPGGIGRKKKMSKATLAGLSHKDILRSRKRQLAAVLGALAHGDTLALDQALSANYPFVRGGVAPSDPQNQDLTKVRPSHRLASRLARAYKTSQARLPSLDAPRSFPQSDFDFTCHNASKCTRRTLS